mmetsp:Transcript_57645/g.117913  ORF Transcript_57645/g.117913 Transcript_57645/m.117913 type:complete len:323 (-) Transcript_57645:905-1873(-)
MRLRRRQRTLSLRQPLAEGGELGGSGSLLLLLLLLQVVHLCALLGPRGLRLLLGCRHLLPNLRRCPGGRGGDGVDGGGDFLGGRCQLPHQRLRRLRDLSGEGGVEGGDLLGERGLHLLPPCLHRRLLLGIRGCQVLLRPRHLRSHGADLAVELGLHLLLLLAHPRDLGALAGALRLGFPLERVQRLLQRLHLGLGLALCRLHGCCHARLALCHPPRYRRLRPRQLLGDGGLEVLHIRGGLRVLRLLLQLLLCRQRLLRLRQLRARLLHLLAQRGERRFGVGLERLVVTLQARDLPILLLRRRFLVGLEVRDEVEQLGNTHAG